MMLQQEICQRASQNSAGNGEADEVQVFVDTGILPDDVIEPAEDFDQQMDGGDEQKLFQKLRKCHGRMYCKKVTEETEKQGHTDDPCVDQIKEYPAIQRLDGWGGRR